MSYKKVASVFKACTKQALKMHRTISKYIDKSLRNASNYIKLWGNATKWIISKKNIYIYRYISNTYRIRIEISDIIIEKISNGIEKYQKKHQYWDVKSIEYISKMNRSESNFTFNKLNRFLHLKLHIFNFLNEEEMGTDFEIKAYIQFLSFIDIFVPFWPKIRPDHIF